MRIGLTLLALIAPTARAGQPPHSSAFNAPGFLSGLIQEFLAPYALIGSLLSDMRVHSFPNSGWWHDFGFMLGLLPYAGGAAAAR